VAQYGNNGAAFGTVACFVQERSGEKRICLLSNQHILQFYQDTSLFRKDERGMYSITCPPVGEIINEAKTRINAFEEAMRIGNERMGGMDKMIAYYHERSRDYIDGSAAQMIEYATIADYVRGSLATNSDAAIARLRRGTRWSNTTPDDDTVHPPPTALAKVGDEVWKYGAASGKKKTGKIVKVGLPKPVVTTFTVFHTPSYPQQPTGMPSLTKKAIPFSAMYEVEGTIDESFQIQGDSGSLLCLANGSAIGLMSIASMENRRRAFAFPIQAVFEALDVEFPAEGAGMALGTGPAKVTTLPIL
jgi:hypothetical protein